MKLAILNGVLLTPFQRLRGGMIVIENGRILGIHDRHEELPEGTVRYDAGQAYVAPGFIDLHVHGGDGHDFMDATPEAFLKIAGLHARHGTTALVPTTLTAEKDDLFRTLDAYEKARTANTGGAQFLGMHLEGPYFALNQRGAQDPRYIRNPDPAEYEEILAYSPSIARWSAAPELDGAIPFGRRLREKGILAAIAHTDALYDDVRRAYEAGYSLVTHLYSCMTGVTRRNGFRHAGVIESAYLFDEMDVELIADGVHLPPPLLQLAYKIKGPEHAALITDAMRAAGLPPGPSILGSLKNGTPVIVEDGVAKLPDRQAFAGSVATADRLLETVLTTTDIPLLDAVRMLTSTPARIMGVADRKGSLAPGMDADLVVFDRRCRMLLTVIGGNVVFRQDIHEGVPETFFDFPESSDFS
ncbi:N-acetylglucosamine-6-phosphate deacetylase [Tellurirhabdus rosea]|uniref:N-acetylglucosamine-6-phosphate deacetylase n=1 Tax=Tellurirhabdus rosea TaxID=2674997 RepID=UPI00224EFB16|nr:N-acetylglucosamine-6-phosphate deacetylase [Tellurirhabdus rosea]